MSATSMASENLADQQVVVNSTQKVNVIESTDMQEIQLCSQLASCESINTFKEMISSILKKLDFSDFSFVTLEGKSQQRMASIPEELCTEYVAKGFPKHDLMLEHVSVSTTPIFLSELDDFISRSPFSSNKLDENKKLFRLFAQYGYHDYYCVPRKIQHHSTKVLFYILDKDSSREEFRQKVAQSKSLLSLLIDAVVYFGIAKFPQSILCNNQEGGIPITPKPLRLLTVMAKEGLMLKDAAIKLCISVDTANKHMAAAKHALGATTLANAVYLAMTNGLIRENEN